MKSRWFEALFVLGLLAAFTLGCGSDPAPPTAVDAPPGLELAGRRVAILIAEGFHSGETLDPKAFLEDLGAQTTLLGPAEETVTAYNDDTVSLMIEVAVEDADPEDYDALILPGGQGPAVLREHEPSVRFAREFLLSGKPVAAICHGPQTLVTADVLEGRTLTAVSGVADEIREAGGEYVDMEVMVDDNLITSRVPRDLPAFNQAILEALR